MDEFGNRNNRERRWSAKYELQREEQMARTARKYPAGTVFEKDYKGKHVKVVTTKNGFRYAGKVYDTLQEAVSKITKGKKYPASVFFSSKATGAKRGRKPKDNGTEVQEGALVGSGIDINVMVQSAVDRIVGEKVAEFFRS